MTHMEEWTKPTAKVSETIKLKFVKYVETIVKKTWEYCRNVK